jgi:hypothetical protein
MLEVGEGPPGFGMRDDGLYWRDPKHPEEPPIRITLIPFKVSDLGLREHVMICWPSSFGGTDKAMMVSRATLRDVREDDPLGDLIVSPEPKVRELFTAYLDGLRPNLRGWANE